MRKQNKQGKKKFGKKTVILVIVVLAIAAAVTAVVIHNKNKAKQAEVTVIESEETAGRRDILNSITATSVLEPKDSYEITSLVSGDIIFAGFEKGDIVNKDDVLYKIDASDTEKNVTSASNSLTRAQKTYNDAVSDLSDLTVVSKYSGKVSNLPVKKGDSVNTGSVVANIYDDTSLDITVPFVEEDANKIYTGQSATVSVLNSSEKIYGTVTKVTANCPYRCIKSQPKKRHGEN